MRAALVILLVIGCSEPSAGTPSQATVLFSLDLHPIRESECITHPFIGRVAFGSDFGYLVTHAALPSCDGGPGNPDEKIPSEVIQFDKRTPMPPTKIGDAGMTQEGGGPRPNIGARGSEVVWTFSDVGSNTIQINSQSGTISGTTTAQMDTTGVLAIVIDDNKTYVASSRTPQGPSNPLHPHYPCCGFSSQPSDFLFVELAHGPKTTSPVLAMTPSFPVDQLRTPLVANASTLFYWQFPQSGSDTRVMSLAKGSPTPTELATIGSSLHPAGLAVTDTHLAWSGTVDYRRMTASSRRCTIDALAFADPTPKQLLISNTFSCFDLAADGTHAYFTIVESVEGDGDSFLRNRGLGRVHLETLAFESIELGIDGPEAAPRQVFVDDDAIIVVAPYVIARIAKSAFDGKHEIE